MILFGYSLIFLSVCLNVVVGQKPCDGVLGQQFRANPTDCRVYHLCGKGKDWRLQCGPNLVWNQEIGTCVAVGSAQDTCTQRNKSPLPPQPPVGDPGARSPNSRFYSPFSDSTWRPRCNHGSGRRFPHPTRCAQYYDCAADPKEDWWGKHLRECPYPTVFNSATGDCEYYDTVNCGQRKVPLDPCDYLASSCRNSHCAPCHVRYASCAGLPDGINVWRGREKTPFYVVCQNNRVTFHGRCINPEPGKRQIYDGNYHTCGRPIDFERGLVHHIHKGPIGASQLVQQIQHTNQPVRSHANKPHARRHEIPTETRQPPMQQSNQNNQKLNTSPQHNVQKPSWGNVNQPTQPSQTATPQIQPHVQAPVAPAQGHINQPQNNAPNPPVRQAHNNKPFPPTPQAEVHVNKPQVQKNAPQSNFLPQSNTNVPQNIGVQHKNHVHKPQSPVPIGPVPIQVKPQPNHGPRPLPQHQGQIHVNKPTKTVQGPQPPVHVNKNPTHGPAPQIPVQIHVNQPHNNAQGQLDIQVFQGNVQRPNVQPPVQVVKQPYRPATPNIQQAQQQQQPVNPSPNSLQTFINELQSNNIQQGQHQIKPHTNTNPNPGPQPIPHPNKPKPIQYPSVQQTPIGPQPVYNQQSQPQAKFPQTLPYQNKPHVPVHQKAYPQPLPLPVNPNQQQRRQNGPNHNTPYQKGPHQNGQQIGYKPSQTQLYQQNIPSQQQKPVGPQPLPTKPVYQVNPKFQPTNLSRQVKQQSIHSKQNGPNNIDPTILTQGLWHQRGNQGHKRQIGPQPRVQQGPMPFRTHPRPALMIETETKRELISNINNQGSAVKHSQKNPARPHQKYTNEMLGINQIFDKGSSNRLNQKQRFHNTQNHKTNTPRNNQVHQRSHQRRQQQNNHQQHSQHNQQRHFQQTNQHKNVKQQQTHQQHKNAKRHHLPNQNQRKVPQGAQQQPKHLQRHGNTNQGNNQNLQRNIGFRGQTIVPRITDPRLVTHQAPVGNSRFLKQQMGRVYPTPSILSTYFPGASATTSLSQLAVTRHRLPGPFGQGSSVLSQYRFP